MGSLLNLPGMQDLLDGTSKWSSSDDFRARLLMTNTTADSENNKATISAYTTLDKFNGSGATDNMALTGEAVTVDAVNALVYIDADDVAWGALGNGTRQIQGVLIFKFVTNDADSVPTFWIEFSSSINPGGATVTIQWDAAGIVQFS